ncbi:MAG: VWA domain-containing protein [Bacteroidota bacterium]
MFQSIQFVNPIFFLLLLLIPVVGLIAWQRRSKREVNLKMSSLKALEATPSLRGRLRSLLPILRALAFASLVIAMARPQSVLQQEEVKAEGIDIMLVMDLSSSMLAQDFKPDRLEVSKAVASEFVRKREYDRMGLVVFAGEAFTQCPLTTDHKILQEFLASLECGMLEDGTAIGMGLASAVNRLKESEADSKVVILLTDGDNNAGYIQPITAAEIAQEFDVRVYTIGVGTMGSAYAPVGRLPGNRYRFGLVTVKIDEALLRQISSMTGGKYFRATTNEALQEIYDEIDELEKTEIEVTTIKRYSEKYHIFVFWGLLFLLLEVILRYSVLRAIP